MNQINIDVFYKKLIAARILFMKLEGRTLDHKTRELIRLNFLEFNIQVQQLFL
jgi:hypothetical protein